MRPAELVVAIVTIAVASFLVWLVWPLDGEMFPQPPGARVAPSAVLFALGVHAGRAGWLVDLPRGLVRRLGWMTVAGLFALLTLLAVAFSPGEELSTRADWPTLLFALFDGVFAVGLALWLVAVVRRRWPAHGPLLAKAGRASYATYFLHPLILTTLMLLQRDHGVTLVVVTHDPTVSTRADRVLHMLDGRIEVTATEDRATDTGVAPPAAIGV